MPACFFCCEIAFAAPERTGKENFAFQKQSDHPSPRKNAHMNEPQSLTGSNAQIQELAQGVFNEVMAAHEEADYARLSPWLSADMAEALSEEMFEEIVAEHLAALGDLQGTDYLGSLQKADATQVLWKARYSSSASEVLWQVFLSREGEEIKVVGLLFS